MLEYWWAIALAALVVGGILLVRTGRRERERPTSPVGRAGYGVDRDRAPTAAAPAARRAELDLPGSYDRLLATSELRQAAEEAGWDRPPATHARTIAALARGDDVVLVADPTPERSGAYVLAALDRIAAADGLDTLILCSDRRHAARVARQARELAADTDFWVGEIHEDGEEDTQLRDLRAGFDVVVATPGRLNRHLRNGAPVLRDVRLVVIDDAARMAGRSDLDRRLGRVLDALPESCQVVLVSTEDSPKLRDKAQALAPGAEWVTEGDSQPSTEPAGSRGRPAAVSPADRGSTHHDGLDGASDLADGDRVSGVVKWFNDSKGYGFLLPDGGDDDVFVHYSAIVGDGFRSLEEGGRVRFAIVDTQKGPEATDVEPL